MKVFNLTDIETKALAQRNLMQQHVAVGDQMLAPGESVDIDDATFARIQHHLQELVMVGVLACGEETADYQAAKAQLVATAPTEPASARPALVRTGAAPAEAPATDDATPSNKGRKEK